MEVIGVVEVKVNQRQSITLTNWTFDKTWITKNHKGAFGSFGLSQSPPEVAGTFVVSIPRTGLEFDFEAEFAGDGGQLQCQSPGGAWRRGFRGVKLAKLSHTTDQATGDTKQTYGWACMKDLKL